MNSGRRFPAFRRLPRWAAASLFVWAASACGGCVAFYGYRDVAVSVRDAETGAPIPAARVDVRYLYMMTLNAPKPATGTTGPDGTVTIRAANFEAQEWVASAEGYPPDRTDLLGKDRGATAVAFRLYHGPPPRVEVIVPDGYRGPLMIDRRPVPARTANDAGRRFTFTASAGGYVRFDATPPLARMDPFDVAVRYADGTPIPRPTAATGAGDVALRSVDAAPRSGDVAGARTLFAVGTVADEAAARAAVEDVDASANHVRSLNHQRFDALFDAAAAAAGPAR